MIAVWRRIPSAYRSSLILWLAALALFAVGEGLSPGFFSFSHVRTILRAASFVGLAAIGQTLVVLTGGIDLSVGPLISLGNVFSCMLLDGKDANNLWAILLILFIGLAVGSLNGFGISVLEISPMVMSMATGVIVTGLTYVYSQGAPKGNASPMLRSLGVGHVAQIPATVLLWTAFTAVIVILLRHTAFGRELRYVGANEKAALFSGIRIHVVKIAAYAISGMLSAFTGVVIAGYTAVAYIGIGNDYTMSSITAVVIGGTAMTGGKGGYGGTVAGAVLLCLIESLLTIMKMHESGKRIINGLVILTLMVLYYRRSAKAGGGSD